MFAQRPNLITHMKSHGVKQSFSKQVERNVHSLRKSEWGSQNTL
jgi:hypothetical protein